MAAVVSVDVAYVCCGSKNHLKEDDEILVPTKCDETLRRQHSECIRHTRVTFASIGSARMWHIIKSRQMQNSLRKAKERVMQ